VVEGSAGLKLWKSKKVRRLEAEIDRVTKIGLDYQREWHRMMNLVKKYDEALEREQDNNKRLIKQLNKNRHK